jgi:CheY-like chemotaxis protein/anti-sigma regulatory factor (Ser/Thr protein kinase)
MEEGALQMSEYSCCIPELIEEVQKMQQDAADQKQIEFLADASDVRDREVLCDRMRLGQILLNLTENAVRFTNPGGCVSVRASQLIGSRREGYGVYEFSIKDNGIGMNCEFQSHLFEPFVRERTSTASGLSGMGLGLAVTKKIVDTMGGTIQVFSEEGHGTAVVVRLELALTPASETEQSSRPKRVLVVEDNELNREIAAEILRERGFSVQTAENGAEAVCMISQSVPGDIDVILMDVQMPVMDGYEAARAIRALENRELADIRIVAMTADDFEDAIRKSAAAGMDGYVAKPFDVDCLLEAIG